MGMMGMGKKGREGENILISLDAQAPDAQAQQLWLTGPAAPWHVGSSQTRARTRVPCIGRQILNHCATREAPSLCIFKRLLVT
ncbi:hypothetical protein J1605_012411 [Eschrichtius robustus]|uniref:Uncharacterized protein n=1 Tax=Eschrichtius robustus TaxID=9764 RepID=A0AB34GKI2_ESCRO|nr:hypothetical protein J1605_012411 [Eschrichtius robustus]